MNYGNYQQPANLVSGRAPKNKSYAILGCLGILGMLFVVILLGGYFYLVANAASQSVVFIREPNNGDRLEVGQPVQVRAIARDDHKIVRLELWVDGQLLDVQTSSTPSGINPFPLLTTWYPEAGTHTLIARSFNSRNATSQATITVEAVTLADRDNDGTADQADACPDQPGNPAADGCPDRDFDGIADASDACPDVAGMPEDGCPAPSETDRDGDGMLDNVDACPDEAGSPLADGCRDTDGDGIADTSDACPAEPGVGDGCLVPDDTAVGGVPDVSDSADDTVAPTDTEDSVVPLDPEDDEVPGERGPIGEGGGWEAIDLVRVDALEFSVSNTEDYDRIYCYAGQVSREMEHYGPFSSLGHQQWDIVEYMGGANSRTMGVLVGDPLVLRVECWAYTGDTLRDLGFISRTYDSSQWDGHVIEELSGMVAEERGDPGHSFQVKFRLCYRTCESADFPPPALHLDHERIGPFDVRYLAWNWPGEPGNITGFRLYVNGNRLATIRNPDANRINLREYMPACGETYEYHVTAYLHDGVTVRESPPSNTIRVAGEPCPRRVKVTFDRLEISGSRIAQIGGDMAGFGPIYGTFVATGANTQTLQFDGGECWTVLWVFWCDGYQLGDGTFHITEMFSDLRAMQAGCIGGGCLPVYAPEVNYVIVELNEGDDLTIAGSIWDEEAYGSNERLFSDQYTFGTDSMLPGEFSLVDENDNGTFTLVIRIEEMSEP